jgi:hypothetical protein
MDAVGFQWWVYRIADLVAFKLLDDPALLALMFC